MPTIQPITPAQVDDAITVIATAIYTVYGSAEPTPDRIAITRAKLLASGSLDEMRDIPAHYDQSNGLFLVLTDASRVVGTGALKRLDPHTAELGRLWFLPNYRHRGLGRSMAERLLTFARDQAYHRVRLDTSEKCTAAIALFRKLGFQEIARYKAGPTTVFMELSLNHQGR